MHLWRNTMWKVPSSQWMALEGFVHRFYIFHCNCIPKPKIQSWKCQTTIEYFLHHACKCHEASSLCYAYTTKNKKEKHTCINFVTGLYPTVIHLFRSRCQVQHNVDYKSSVVPVYSTICLNIMYHHMVQSSLQIINTTCCIQTVTFSFNTETSSVSCHRVMVLKKANIAALSTCPSCKGTSYADGVLMVVFRDFCLLHTIRSCVNMHVRVWISDVATVYFYDAHVCMYVCRSAVCRALSSTRLAARAWLNSCIVGKCENTLLNSLSYLN